MDIGAIINDIIEFFKGLKKNKEAGVSDPALAALYTEIHGPQGVIAVAKEAYDQDEQKAKAEAGININGHKYKISTFFKGTKGVFTIASVIAIVVIARLLFFHKK